MTDSLAPLSEADRRLLRRFAAGETAACRAVERWAREIVFFRGFSLSAEDREDAVQDTLAGLWRAVSQTDFELRHGVRALVRTIAGARCVDRLRRRRPTTEVDESLPDAGPDPYERMLATDESTRLRLALGRLDPRCREVIRLHFLEEQSYAEIAERESRSESTLRVRLFNCMKTLRRLFAGDGG